MTATTRLYTKFFGKCVGTDAFGNRYFVKKGKKKAGMREKRWVQYASGLPEPSQVPASWHGWLHHTFDVPPKEAKVDYAWMKPHQPNPTGTEARYLPPGHLLRGGQRAPSTSDYQPWVPE